MSKRDKDYAEKIKKKLDEVKFRSPSKLKDPKFLQKKLKDLDKAPKKKMEPKKDKKAFLKAVLAKLNN